MKILRVKLDRVGHTLSIEDVYLLFILVVEGFVREILLGALNFRLYRLLIFKNALVLSVVQEMVVGSRVVVEKGHKDGVIVDEAAVEAHETQTHCTTIKRTVDNTTAAQSRTGQWSSNGDRQIFLPTKQEKMQGNNWSKYNSTSTLWFTNSANVKCNMARNTGNCFK